MNNRLIVAASYKEFKDWEQRHLELCAATKTKPPKMIWGNPAEPYDSSGQSVQGIIYLQGWTRGLTMDQVEKATCYFPILMRFPVGWPNETTIC